MYEGNARYALPYETIEDLLAYNDTHQLPIENKRSLLNFQNVQFVMENNASLVQAYMQLASVEEAEIIQDYVKFFNDEYVLQKNLTDKGSQELYRFCEAASKELQTIYSQMTDFLRFNLT